MRRQSRRTWTLLIPLILLTLGLAIANLVMGSAGPADRLRAMGAAVFGPIEEASSSVARSLADGASGLTGSSRREKERLQRENDAYRLTELTTRDDQRRVAELDALLGTAGRGQYRIVPARVVAVSGPQDSQRLVTLDVGSRDGVRRDLTVLSGGGLVGRVIRVAAGTCDVLLVTDPGFSVGVRLEATGLIGVATGAGRRPLDLRLLEASTEVAPGARLVTLGSARDSPFVPGIPVGEVASVRTSPGTFSRFGTVKLYADLSSLDLVGVVVQPPRTDPRDSVLPPGPQPEPSTTVPPVTPALPGSPSPTAGTVPGPATTEGTAPGPGSSPPPSSTGSATSEQGR